MHLNNEADVAEQFQFCGENLGTQLREWVERDPDKVFFHWHPYEGDGGRAWTYGQFWADINAVACGLQKRGTGVGDKVIIHADNCPEFLIAWYACALIGAVAVTTNTGATASEMTHYITATESRAAITQPKYASLLHRFSDQLDWIAVTDTNNDGTATEDIPDGLERFSALVSGGGGPALADCKALTPAGIVFTSGTTGLSKAVVHTHANILWAGITGSRNMDMRPDDIMLAYLPLFHVNAQIWCVASALGVGATVVLLPKLSVSRFWAVAQQYRITHMTGLPLLLNGASADVPKTHSLKRVVMAELPELEALWGHGVRFISVYGSSETVIHALASSSQRRWPTLSLGRPVPGYQAQLINPDTGSACSPGENGELWVKGTRGVQLFLEYYNDPKATESAFVDGWFRTGDLIRFDEQGQMYFSHRLKDVIKVGGENVGVDEVEAVIMQLPQVMEVAVVAKQDPNLDEVPVAYIRSQGDIEPAELESIILEHCREHMSAFKIPRHVCVVEDFPRALLNKIAKNKLREMAEAL